MAAITIDHISAFLTEVGHRYQQPATLILLGGSALCLLGSKRATVDIDYTEIALTQCVACLCPIHEFDNRLGNQ